MQTTEASELKMTRSFASSGLALVVQKVACKLPKKVKQSTVLSSYDTQEPQLLSQHNDPQYRCSTVTHAFEVSGSSLIRLKTSLVRVKSHLVLEI